MWTGWFVSTGSLRHENSRPLGDSCCGNYEVQSASTDRIVRCEGASTTSETYMKRGGDCDPRVKLPLAGPLVEGREGG